MVPTAHNLTEVLSSVAPLAAVSLPVTSTVIGASRLPDRVSAASVGGPTTVIVSLAVTV